nr:hypothetical protein [Rhizobium sp.]
QSVANNLQTTHRFDAEFIKLSRQNIQLRDEMIEFRSEMSAFRKEVNSRLEALFHRVGELENVVEGCVIQLREFAIEARSQYNDILNALQGNLQNRSAIDDLNERLEALERRFGV